MDRDNRTKVFILVENLIMEDSHPLVTDFPSEFQNIKYSQLPVPRAGTAT